MRAEDKANAVKCYRLKNLGEGCCVVKNLALPKEELPLLLASWRQPM